jgi:hypothetical protein
MGSPSSALEVLTVRFSWDLMSFFGVGTAEVFVNMQPAGTGSLGVQNVGLGPSWMVASADPSLMDSFTLQSHTAINFLHHYDLISNNRDCNLGSLKEHFWDPLGMVYVSGECEEGHIQITELLSSRLIGDVTFGASRTFAVEGSRPGRIELEALPGYNEFSLSGAAAQFDPAAYRAFMTASIILLTRAIRHHDSR